MLSSIDATIEANLVKKIRKRKHREYLRLIFNVFCKTRLNQWLVVDKMIKETSSIFAFNFSSKIPNRNHTSMIVHIDWDKVLVLDRSQAKNICCPTVTWALNEIVWVHVLVFATVRLKSLLSHVGSSQISALGPQREAKEGWYVSKDVLSLVRMKLQHATWNLLQ